MNTELTERFGIETLEKVAENALLSRQNAWGRFVTDGNFRYNQEAQRLDKRVAKAWKFYQIYGNY